MKTRGLMSGTWLAILAVTAVILASGCGAPTGASDKEATVKESPASTNTAEVVAEPAAIPAAAETNATPIVKRMDRPAPLLPESIAKVMELVESGAGEEVVRAYVAASNERYELNLDQIIYLRDVGVPDGVIAAMMRRGSELRERDAETAQAQTNLVTAVEQIKQSLAANGNGTGDTPPPTPPAATPESAAPPAPSPVVSTATQPPPEAPQPVQQFYSSLSPYGNWYQVPTYGWVWQPSVVVVNSGWMPYQHGGSWVWTDWGWYWHSEYSWGWAPFHYGRWCTYPGIGWCWVPDSVWGPSWVTWRHCDSHIGWAPLPPACGWVSGVGLTWHGSGVSVGFGFGLASSCYTFVPYHNFCHRNVGHYAIRSGDHDAIYHRSTVINNVIHGDNNVIVNNGVGYTQVASRVRGEVPKARIESLPSEANQHLRADHMERGKNGNVVYRPTPIESAGGRPMALRTEVKPVSAPTSSRPSSTASSGFANSPSGRPASTSTTRPQMKPVESRGAYSSPAAGSASPLGRPSSTPRPYAVGATPTTARPYSTTPTSKTVELRGNDSAQTPHVGGGTASPSVGPVRRTAPVPLSDPSRYVPGRQREPAPVSSGNPYVTGNASPTPNYRAASPTPNATPSVSRPSYSTPTPNFSAPTAPTIQRPSYSGPGPASAPTMNIPRPSYSAPSTPSAPAPSAPRPSYSNPSPAPATPSAAPASRGGTRSQAN